MVKWKSIFIICWCFISLKDGYSAESEKEEIEDKKIDFYAYYAKASIKEKEQPQHFYPYEPLNFTSTYNPYPPPFNPYHQPSAPNLDDPLPHSPDGDTTGSLPIVPQSEMQLQLLVPKETKEKETMETKSEQIRLLEEQNNYLRQLIELGQTNQKQLQVISEALGLNMETTERIENKVESLHDKFSFIKKAIEKDKKSTLYLVYHTIQGGLQLTRAGFGAVATIKTLSLLPAFIIPGWAVYASGIGVGAFMYLLKL